MKMNEKREIVERLTRPDLDDFEFRIHLDLIPNHDKDMRMVVVCHGLLQAHDSPLIKALADSIPLNTCRFDFVGNGENTRKLPQQVLDDIERVKQSHRSDTPGDPQLVPTEQVLSQLGSVRTGYGNYEEEVRDLHHVVDYLTKKGFDVVGVVGHSKAASVVLMYAAELVETRHGLLQSNKDQPLFWIVMVSGRFDMTKPSLEHRFNRHHLQLLDKQGWFVWRYHDTALGQRHPYIVTRQELEHRTRLDMSRFASALEQHPQNRQCIQVLLVHGSADKVVPSDDALEYQRAMPNKCRCVMVDGASHFWAEPWEVEVLVRQMNAFIHGETRPEVLTVQSEGLKPLSQSNVDPFLNEEKTK